MCEVILAGKIKKREAIGEVASSVIRNIYMQHIRNERKEYDKINQKSFNTDHGNYFTVWEYEKREDRDRVYIRECRLMKGKRSRKVRDK